MKQISLSSRALKMAHILQKNNQSPMTNHQWSDMLRHAWYFVRFREMLKTSIMTFTYIKKDGELREARGTLNGVIIPKEKWPRETICDRLPNYSVITYWDIDAHDWRCFRITDFIGFVSIYKIEEVKNKIL